MSNVCNCPEPPGGQATCPPDRLAICRIVDGRIKTDCLGPPPGNVVANRTHLSNWILKGVMGDNRSLSQSIAIDEITLLDMALLAAGHGETVDPEGDRVSFKLSSAMIKALSRDDERNRGRVPGGANVVA